MARLSLALLVFCALAASANPIKKTQKRTPITLSEGKPRLTLAERAELNGRTLHEEIVADKARVLLKYKRNFENLERNKREKRAGSSATISLTDVQESGVDEFYYGSLGMGTPAQSITFDFDTGSSDLWVPTTLSLAVEDGNHFHAYASSTYHQTSTPFEVTYGSGVVAGTVAYDTVRFGSLTSTNQYFGAVNIVSESFDDNPATGLCGLAYQSLASTGHAPLPFNLYAEGALAHPEFMVRLTRGTSSGAELTMGGVAPDYATSTFVTTRVTSQTYYEVQATSMTVQGVTASSSFPAAIDTGTTLFYVPTSVAAAFFSKIPGAKSTSATGGVTVPGAASATSSTYTYPCNFAGPVGIAFNGAGNLNINMADFNLGSAGNGQCTAAVQGLDIQDSNNNDFAIVGDTFIKSYATLFNFGANTVSFSPAHGNA